MKRDSIVNIINFWLTCTAFEAPSRVSGGRFHFKFHLYFILHVKYGLFVAINNPIQYFVITYNLESLFFHINKFRVSV